VLLVNLFLVIHKIPDIICGHYSKSVLWKIESLLKLCRCCCAVWLLTAIVMILIFLCINFYLRNTKI
jgi:hypothetical protein